MKRLFNIGDQTLFLLSNMLFSGSTYIVLLSIPYMITLEKMAQFSSMYNIFILLLFIFELGISIGFLRSYKIHHNYRLLYVIFQIIILFIILLLFLSSLKSVLLYLFDIDKLNINLEIFLFALLGQLSWIYLKNILLVKKLFEYMFLLAFIILLVRLGGIIYLFMRDDIHLDQILISVFIAPFSIIFLALFFYDFAIFKDELHIFIKSFYKKRLLKILFFYFRKFLSFSSISYINGILYLLAGRYLIIYLTKNDALDLLANLGFASIFLGIISILSATYKSYFIGSFHIGDKESIRVYLSQYFTKLPLYVLVSFIISFGISLIVYLIQPAYLDIKSPLFSFILLFSYSLLFLMSLITFLSKTMNYNILEFKINTFRLIITVICIHLLILEYPISGFILLNTIMVITEVWFVYQVLWRIKYVK